MPPSYVLKAQEGDTWVSPGKQVPGERARALSGTVPAVISGGFAPFRSFQHLAQ